MPNIHNLADLAAWLRRFQHFSEFGDRRGFREQMRMVGENPPLVEILPQEEVDELGIVGQEIKVSRHDLPDDIGRRGVFGHRLQLNLFQPGVDGLEDGGVEPLLVTEIVVQHPLVATGRRHDLVHGYAVVADTGEKVYSCRQQALLPMADYWSQRDRFSNTKRSSTRCG